MEPYSTMYDGLIGSEIEIGDDRWHSLEQFGELRLELQSPPLASSSLISEDGGRPCTQCKAIVAHMWLASVEGNERFCSIQCEQEYMKRFVPDNNIEAMEGIISSTSPLPLRMPLPTAPMMAFNGASVYAVATNATTTTTTITITTTTTATTSGNGQQYIGRPLASIDRMANVANIVASDGAAGSSVPEEPNPAATMGHTVRGRWIPEMPGALFFPMDADGGSQSRSTMNAIDLTSTPTSTRTSSASLEVADAMLEMANMSPRCQRHHDRHRRKHRPCLPRENMTPRSLRF